MLYFYDSYYGRQLVRNQQWASPGVVRRVAGGDPCQVRGALFVGAQRGRARKLRTNARRTRSIEKGATPQLEVLRAHDVE